MGFGAYASQAGIQHYYSREDYEQAQGTGDFDGYWGIWDEPFLQYMARQLNTMPQPFFASVFTLTSHHPFVVPEQYRNTLPAGKTKVHKGVAYTDLAIRRFMETASQESWYDHTIFVFVADHVSSETFAPKTLTPTGNSHIICLLYTPDGAIRRFRCARHAADRPDADAIGPDRLCKSRTSLSGATCCAKTTVQQWP